MNANETYIKLKYFPIQHTYEYLNSLPEDVVIEMYKYVGKKPLVAYEPEIKEIFLNEYIRYIEYLPQVKANIEYLIEKELSKHYRENTHSIIE